jgi:hypothetical protein
MIQAQKFTFQYDAIEDRLKLLVNYDSVENRIDLFITRAMLFRLIPVIEKILITTQTPIQEDRDHLHVNPKRLGQKQKTDTSTLQLLQENHINLLEKVDFKFNQKAKMITMIFWAKGEAQCSAQLTAENFSQIMNAMIAAVPHTSWGMAPNILEI